MNTTSKLTLAATVAIAAVVAWSEQACGQVYSRCPVGYVNVGFPAGFSMRGNPMVAAPDNTLTNIMQNGTRAVGTAIYLWDGTNQTWSEPSVFQGESVGWSINYDLPPGKGFMVYSPLAWTNTFIGELACGTNLTFLGGNYDFSLVSCPIPIAGDLLGPDFGGETLQSLFPVFDAANALLFRTATQYYSDVFTYFDQFGWFDSSGAAGTNGPAIDVAEALFVQNPGPDANWITVFTFSPVLAAASLPPPNSTSTPIILRLAAHAGMVTLDVVGAGSAPYDVEFSLDGVCWITVAPEQTGPRWQGPLLGGMQGFYRLNPR